MTNATKRAEVVSQAMMLKVTQSERAAIEAAAAREMRSLRIGFVLPRSRHSSERSTRRDLMREPAVISTFLDEVREAGKVRGLMTEDHVEIIRSALVNSRDAAGVKATDYTTGTSAPGTGDIELRFNTTDTNSKALTVKDVVLALDIFARQLEAGPLGAFGNYPL